MDSVSATGWGAIVTSIIAMLVFAGSVVAAFYTHDTGLLNIAVGAAVANATTVVNFWLGSSNGSQKKDAALAAAASLGTPP